MKQHIQIALQAFASNDLYTGAKAVLNSLGYASDKDAITIDIACNHEAIKQAVGLFQLADEDLSNQSGLLETGQFNDKIVYSFLFVAVELKDKHYNRTVLRQMTHSINQQFKMPVIILFRYAGLATLSIIDFRLNKTDNSKDVLGKVTSIKDINLKNTHRAQLDILAELSLAHLKEKYTIKHFAQLHDAWQKTLDTKTLNDNFYKELSYWYFWAVQKVQFPNPNKDAHNSETSVIRLLTRLMFIWFIKEKGLVNPNLFNQNKLDVLIDLAKEGSYYRAIIQNLFFATLNCPIENRAFATDGTFVENKNEYCVNNLYRYISLFKINETDALALFESTPFLNGGLFECLDTCDNAKHKKIYVDGFSRNLKQAALIPNELFFADATPVDLNDIYDTRGKNYTVKGLIEILNSYKFTVEENTPLDVEIALDPELLGKVFENLLASYNPETGATARKATGSFYTPREIVDYMVTSSLKNYLSDTIEDSKLDSLLAYDHNLVELSALDKKKLIDKLDQLTIIDPAIGSGAFPMGLLHKITHLLGKIDPENKLWKQKLLNATPAALRSSVEKTLNNSNLDYARKLHLIQSTIYGVDIQPVAVQIAKLRFFISLVIEQNHNTDKSDNYGITALPNLETKFVCANSLLPLKTYDKSILTLEEINQAADTANNLFTNTDMFFADIPSKEKEIADNREQHFYTNNREKKKAIIDTDKQLRAELSLLLIQNGMPAEQAGMLAEWNPYDPNQSAAFFDAEFMFGITKGFDIVIGNPPYIRQEKIKDIKPILKKSNYACYNGTADIYIYFFELGHKLLSSKGILSYITSNKYTRANYGKEFRNFLLKQAHLIEYIDFNGVAVFESATVDTSILSFSKQVATKNDSLFYCSVEKDYTGDALVAYCAKKGFAYQQSDLVPEGFSFVNSQELAVKKQIEIIGTPLKDWDINIYRGILTGFNEAFIIDTAKRDELVAQDPKSAELIKPTLRGRDVKRYGYEWAGLWLINIHNNPPVDIIKYPAIKAHLDLFYPQLEKRSDQGASPYNLRNCAYLKEFEKEKIIYAETMRVHKNDAADRFPRFSFSAKEFYTDKTCFFATGNDLKYILSIINSSLGEYLLYKYVARLDTGGFNMQSIFIEQLLLPKISPKKQALFITLVDYILYARSQGLVQEAKYFEAVIDIMVFGLYFEASMKKNDCYINDEVAKTLKPLIETETFIKEQQAIFNENIDIKRGLVFSRVVPEVVTIYKALNHDKT